MKAGDQLQTFVIQEVLGHGGMGGVFVGSNTETGELVAIKTLFEEFSNDEAYVRRFQREASVYRKLNHPNIVRCIASGFDKGIYFIAMEHIKGKPLSDILKENGALGLEHSLKIMDALAGAVYHAHSRGVIHRDIKPQNIMINEDGVVKLLDFGVSQTDDDLVKTASGSILGTFFYSSPEQNQGLKIDERSDLYSLGLVFYEMLTGQRALNGSTLLEVSQLQNRGKIKPPSALDQSIPRNVDRVVLKLIERDPNQRHQSARDVQADIVRCLEGPQGPEEVPGLSGAADRELTARWSQAKEALARRDLDKALALAQEVGKLKTESAEVHCLLGKIYAAKEFTYNAIEEFKKTLALDPGNCQYKVDFALALYSMKMIDRAKEEFRKVLEIDPDNPFAKQYLQLIEETGAIDIGQSLPDRPEVREPARTTGRFKASNLAFGAPQAAAPAPPVIVPPPVPTEGMAPPPRNRDEGFFIPPPQRAAPPPPPQYPAEALEPPRYEAETPGPPRYEAAPGPPTFGVGSQPGAGVDSTYAAVAEPGRAEGPYEAPTPAEPEDGSGGAVMVPPPRKSGSMPSFVPPPRRSSEGHADGEGGLPPSLGEALGTARLTTPRMYKAEVQLPDMGAEGEGEGEGAPAGDGDHGKRFQSKLRRRDDGDELRPPLDPRRAWLVSLVWWGGGHLYNGLYVKAAVATLLQAFLLVCVVWPFSSRWSNRELDLNVLVTKLKAFSSDETYLQLVVGPLDTLADSDFNGWLRAASQSGLGWYLVGGAAVLYLWYVWSVSHEVHQYAVLFNLTGKIVEVRRDLSITINLGEDRGVRVGQIFSVAKRKHIDEVRALNFKTMMMVPKLMAVGEAKVISTTKHRALCKFRRLPGETSNPSMGDRVSLKRLEE